MRGPRTSVFLTKIMSDCGDMRSATRRSSKLMMAAMRARSWSLKILRGVRWSTPMNSSKVRGV